MPISDEYLYDVMAYQKRGSGGPAPEWLQALGAISRWELPDSYEVENQGVLYRQLSWVQVAVSAVALAGAGVAFNVKRRSGEKLVDLPNHAFEQLLAHPNPFDSRFELLRDLFSHYRLNGNGYLWLSREHEYAEPDELFVLPSQFVTPVPDGKLGLAGYLFDSGYGPEIPLYPWEVCHIRTFNPLSRFVGLSPLEAIQIGARGDMAAQRWSANFYGKDNAKIPGALAFRDMVNDPDWLRIKADIKEGWGGSNRSGPLLLRGVGAGGVDWVQMGLSQNDMQYLQSRQFTKEEIYALFAPGLASTLDVNATEANSRTGKASFIEFSVWPMLAAVAEKITADILTSYDRRSRTLVGSFEDIKPTDKSLELQEQQRAEQVLTIDELRERYYQLPALPGDRGARLISEPLALATPHTAVLPGSPRLLTDGRETPQVKADIKAALKPDEQGLFSDLARVFRGNANLDEVLRDWLGAVMAAEVARALLSIGSPDLDTEPPINEWLSSFIPLAIGILHAAGPGPDDENFLGWLMHKVVSIVTAAQAWVMERLSDWLNRPEAVAIGIPSFELVWAAMLDGRACRKCLDLDGTPKRLIPSDIKPGTVHLFCRCHWDFALVPDGIVEEVTFEGVGDGSYSN